MLGWGGGRLPPQRGESSPCGMGVPTTQVMPETRGSYSHPQGVGSGVLGELWSTCTASVWTLMPGESSWLPSGDSRVTLGVDMYVALYSYFGKCAVLSCVCYITEVICECCQQFRCCFLAILEK